MWRSKKFIIIAVLAAVLLAGSVGGVAFAQTGNESNDSGKTLLARVATIMGVDQKKLEDAFAQAQREMRDEALNSRLQDLVSQGKMTQDQADQYKKWLQSEPQVSLPGPRGHFGWGGKFGGGPCPPQATPQTQ